MQLTLLWLHPWILTAKPFKFTTQPCSNVQQCAAMCSVHQSPWFSKVHNSVKLDMRSSEWDDTRCVTCAWDTVDRNRRFLKLNAPKCVQKGRCTRSAQYSCKEASLSCTLSQAHIRIETIPSTKIFNHSAHFLCCSIVQPLRGPTH